MFVFEQSTGRLLRDGKLFGQGWSGQPPHKNDSDGQAAQGVGPLPRGRYTISPPYTHPLLGPVVMKLFPVADTGEVAEPYPHMFGRSLFRIHGASADNADFSSKGCIVMPRSVREAIVASGDTELEVVRGAASLVP